MIYRNFTIKNAFLKKEAEEKTDKNGKKYLNIAFITERKGKDEKVYTEQLFGKWYDYSFIPKLEGEYFVRGDISFQFEKDEDNNFMKGERGGSLLTASYWIKSVDENIKKKKENLNIKEAVELDDDGEKIPF